MRRLRATITLVLAALGLLLARPAGAQSSAAPPEGYTLGGGLPLGASGVRLGGYITVDFENPSTELATLTFDDASLFVFGDLGARARFFMEAEATQFWQIDSTGRVEAASNGDLERLYFDYLHADTLKVRAGKFLTPVGTWNEIHPDPLTWTVSRPVASFGTFPTFTTGIQAFGTWAGDNRDVDYNIFVQHNPALDRSTGERHTEKMIGGRIRLRQGGWEVGVPAVHYVESETADVVTFSGADLLARTGRLEVRGEATAGRVRSTDGNSRTEFAEYLQGMVALTDRLFVVGRHEWARSRDELTYNAASAGLLFRPLPAMSLKLEFQAQSGRFFATDASKGNQLLAGFGVLF
jgi:hypothetical protein